jgi:Protein of unknown function (DUF3096)
LFVHPASQIIGTIVRHGQSPSVRQRTVGGPDQEEHCIRPLIAPHKGNSMNITLSLAPLVSLIAGILILVVPRLLNYIVAAYLIIAGLLGLFGDIRLR